MSVATLARASEPKRRTRDEERGEDGPQPVAERVLVLVRPLPGAQRLLRRAWRSAQRLGGELDVLYVAPPASRPSDEELEILRRLASTLGAAYLQEEGDDVAATAGRVAEERDTTYVLMGQPRPATELRRLSHSLPEKLMERMPGVDVRIVADRQWGGEGR